jgi:nucleolar protein 56
LNYYLVASELGLVLLDGSKKPVSKLEFSPNERAKSFLEVTSGNLSQEQLSWLNQSVTEKNSTMFSENQLATALLSQFPNTQTISDDDLRSIRKNQIELLVEAGLATSKEDVEEVIREVSIDISNLRIKEMSSNPDLQAMESVQALDEIDKTANIISARLREWYGLHFPELASMVDDNVSLAKLVVNFKSRPNYDAGLLEEMGYSKAKSRAIETAARESRGADLRDEDISRIIQLAEEALHLFSLRDKLASHVEKTMRQVAPNLSEIAGATIGARLIARAGGLQKLSILPASTIQILGAEKALYRALKSGARPPKHGILFQHASVHSAPKWQRGKIARSVAGKIAIAARIDTFRGSKDESILASLETRLDEIKEKYKEAPRREKEEKREFRPQGRRFFEEKRRSGERPPEKGFERHQREEGGGKRRDQRKRGHDQQRRR